MADRVSLAEVVAALVRGGDIVAIQAETEEAVVSPPEIIRYWLRAGRIDSKLLGAVQLERFANIDTTTVGPELEAPGDLKTRTAAARGMPGEGA